MVLQLLIKVIADPNDLVSDRDGILLFAFAHRLPLWHFSIPFDIFAMPNISLRPTPLSEIGFEVDRLTIDQTIACDGELGLFNAAGDFEVDRFSRKKSLQI